MPNGRLIRYCESLLIAPTRFVQKICNLQLDEFKQTDIPKIYQTAQRQPEIRPFKQKTVEYTEAAPSLYKRPYLTCGIYGEHFFILLKTA